MLGILHFSSGWWRLSVKQNEKTIYQYHLIKDDIDQNELEKLVKEKCKHALDKLIYKSICQTCYGNRFQSFDCPDCGL